MANTSFFTTFAMLHFTTEVTIPTNMYLTMKESLVSTITDTSINTST